MGRDRARLRCAVTDMYEINAAVENINSRSSAFQLIANASGLEPSGAERAGFRGSPTILVNGCDPFAGPDDPVGLSCRIYRAPAGVKQCPQRRAAPIGAH